MRTDPYDILGVKRDATQKDIQSAFRKLAKKHHPDLNPGDQKAEALFKEISAANELLGDADKRRRFDRGEIDINGEERAPRYQRQHAGAGAGQSAGQADAAFFDHGFSDIGGFEDIFASFMSRRGDPQGPRGRGADMHFSMEIDFLDAVNGKTVPVAMPEGGSLDVKIPPGTRDGQTLRLRGKGTPGGASGPAGDALIEIRVRPHRFFTRDGDDIRLDLPVSVREAVLGGKVRVPTPGGEVQLTLKPHSNTGSVLRLKGKGVRKPDGNQGDLYVRLQIVLPEAPDADLTAFFESHEPAVNDDPRRKMMI